jgi:predicted nucleic acid-binding protein
LDIDLILSARAAIPPNEAIARRAYYLMRTWARSHGRQPIDSLIAATALEEGHTLITKNRKHFAMIRDLRLETPRY